MEELKPTEKQIYDFIVKFISEHGYSPSYREICKGVFLCSTQTIHANMRSLAQKGYLKYEPSKSRTIVILKENKNV